MVSLTDEEIARFAAHFDLLLRWNKTMNLTRVVGVPEAAVKHYGESAFLARWLRMGASSVVDVGSGGGFPGIPIAILRPEVQVTLVESHQRKATFLREAARSLANVRVLASRGEQVPDRFDWVVSRAVAWRELQSFAFRLAPEVALLTREGQVLSEIERIPLPWADSGFLVHVSRETSCA